MNSRQLHDESNTMSSLPEEVAGEILRAIAAIRYGSVEVLVHGGRVVQIEAREKRRFDRGGATG